MLRIAALVVGLFFGLGVGLDAFQTMVLPRRPSGKWRITRLYFVLTWNPWSAIASRIKNKPVREEFYAIYGPISLILLLVIWALLLVCTFALIFFALGSPFKDVSGAGMHSLLGWLRTHVHGQGSRLGFNDLLREATGKPLDPADFEAHLAARYLT